MLGYTMRVNQMVSSLNLLIISLGHKYKKKFNHLLSDLETVLIIILINDHMLTKQKYHL